MGRITSGVFPVHNTVFEIGRTKASGGAWTYAKIADMENFEFSVETGVEEWNAMENDGWRSALATAKSITVSVSGKRHVGDAGNDYVASMIMKNGQDAYSNLKITFANGDVLVMDCVISLTGFMGGDTTNVAPLSADFISHKKPTFTPAG